MDQQPILIFTYAKCSTCRKATVFLRQHGIDFEERPIRETPPDPDQLRRMAAACDGQWRRVCNNSSADYRDINLGKRIDALGDDEIIRLLQANGNLVKRPFVLGCHTPPGGEPRDIELVGFKEDRWREAFGLPAAG